jgi:hypothetical protein
VIGVLLRLQALSLRGRIVRSLRLLRQPKYLIGSIAGALWMLAWVGRPILRSSGRYRTVGLDLVPADVLPTVHLAVALVVTLGIVLPWLWPWGRPGLRLREAELTFLLQAPLTRRQVIGYALLKAGVGTLVSAAILAWILGRGLAGRITLFAAILALFAFWGLNGKWRSMFLLRQREHPQAFRRRAILTVVCGGYAFLLVFLASRFLPHLLSGGPSSAWPPVLTALLLPGRLLTAPLFASGTGPVLAAAAPIALLALVQLELVLRSRAPFEETSLEWAKENEARRAIGRHSARPRGGRGRRWQVFELEGAGRAEVAILWKNLMRVSRLPLARGATFVILLLAALVTIAWIVPVYSSIYGTICIAGLVAAGTAPLFAGMSWYNDLRTELPHLELVRTWPVAPVRFVLAEVAAPALLSTLVGLFGLGLALAGYVGEQIGSGRGASLDFLPDAGTLGVPTAGFILLAMAGYVPVLAGAAFASSALQNTATLLVPAWMVHAPDTQRGFAAVGRNLIVGTGMFLGFLFALLPSAALVGLALMAQRLAGIPWSAWAFPLWGILAAAPLFLVGGMLVLFAGALWIKLDPSAELLEIGR